MLKRTVGAAVAVIATTIGAQPGFATAFADLSAEAQTIVNQVKADTDANTACKSKDSLESAVKAAVEQLTKSGELTGKPHDQAVEAGRYMYENCGSV
jgi:hypothetical protein